MKAEVIYNLPFAEYQKIDALNNSTIVKFAKTPAHSQVQDEVTAAMRFGAAGHAYFLEPKVWEKDYCVAPPDLDLRTKAGKEWKAQADGKTVLPNDEGRALLHIDDNLFSGRYETAKNLIQLGSKEVSIVWTDRKFGIKRKARLDLLLEDMGVIADLKFTTTADPVQWLKMLTNAKKFPHFQACTYLDAANAVFPEKKFDTFLWILLETKPPHGISVVQACPAPPDKTNMAYLAKLQMEPLIEQYLECKRTGNFPCYPDRIVYGELPSYYVKTAL